MIDKDGSTYKRFDNAYGFVLCDPFEVVLARLSEEYLSEAWSKLDRKLQDLDLKFSNLKYGWIHAGLVTLPCEMNPISFYGWVTDDIRSKQEEERIATEIQSLRESVPGIAFGASSEVYQAEFQASSHKDALVDLLDYATCEVSVWDPDYLISNVEASPQLHQLLNKLKQRDFNAIGQLLGEAENMYSQAGIEILRKGFELWREKGHRPEE